LHANPTQRIRKCGEIEFAGLPHTQAYPQILHGWDHLTQRLVYKSLTAEILNFFEKTGDEFPRQILFICSIKLTNEEFGKYSNTI